MVVHSYANSITLSIIAKSWAVPDADLFLSWVVEEYQSLLRQATEEARTAEKNHRHHIDAHLDISNKREK
jgi:hypothetical protein